MGPSFAEPPPRRIFGTKTAFAQYLLATAGVLTAFFPDAVPWINTHAGEVMLVASGVNRELMWQWLFPSTVVRG